MAIVSSFLLIFLLTLIIYSESVYVDRDRRQIVDGTNRNVGMPQPMNNYPFNPSNNPNLVVSNERNNPKQNDPNNNLYGPSPQPQMPPVRSRGYYDNPGYQQPPPFMAEKPSGWFGTNHFNWPSHQESELDKNKLAAMKTAGPNNPQANMVQKPREDGGPLFLQKVAKQYASKGFRYGQFESRQGPGAVCSNYENFDGYQFRIFPCPLPPSTGMNQLDQFCCGPMNYQYCCNAQEFSQTQRGGFADPRMFDQQRYSKPSGYPSSTKKLLAIILPIASLVVLAGVGVLLYLFYKKFRSEQNRARKLSGAIRLEDTYSIVPQEAPIERDGFSSR